MPAGALRRRAPLVASAVLGVTLVASALVPTPYYLIAPGAAVDLTRAVTVEGHAPPLGRYYLTDVTLQPASVLLLAGSFFPGIRLMRQSELIPRGVPAPDYDRILARAMDESQDVAAVVAERAAGLTVSTPPTNVIVEAFTRGSRAASELRVGDIVRRVDGEAIRNSGQIAKTVARLRAGELVPVDIERGGRRRRVGVRTMLTPAGTRFGIVIAARYARPVLPVPIRFALDNVQGSSGGLMFALDIYAALKPQRAAARVAIAGTGTLAYDGSVGPIEGTPQKLIAAKRAGARIFFVPKENYADVRGERDVRVIPVGSFSEALRALD